MEKRKLLLVAISAGLFLVISIGAAIMVFTPQNTALPAVSQASRFESPTGISVNSENNPETVSPYSNNGVTLPGSSVFDPVEVVRGNTEFPGLQEGIVLQENSFHVSGADQVEAERQINVPRPSAAAVPATPPAGRASPQTVAAPSQAPASTQPAIPAPVNSPRPAASQPAASTAQPAPAAQAAPTTPAAPASAAPAAQPSPAATSTVAASPAPASTPASVTPSQRVQDDFWVQTGSFSTIARAELVKENLSTRGITSLIENRDIDGRTFYRVRVGPYTSFNEANYWLSLIQSIDGFQDSQIWQTPARR